VVEVVVPDLQSSIPEHCVRVAVSVFVVFLEPSGFVVLLTSVVTVFVSELGLVEIHLGTPFTVPQD